jgi:S1-C subfamily serine protease
MQQALAAAVVVCLLAGVTVTARQGTVLSIKVTVLDADQRPRPVPRHALLISDNPVSAAPARVVTSTDGTAQIHLRPGNYTIESDEALIFQGKSYEWRQTLDVPAGRTTVLELTAANANVETAAPGAAGAASPSEADANASGLLIDWQNSVVAIWTPTRQGAGVVVDARGLIATNQHIVGGATAVEVQLSSSEKFLARVVAADADRNVAVLWLDPKPIAAARPAKLGYADATGKAPVANDDRIFAIEASVHDVKRLASGTVKQLDAHTITPNIIVGRDSSGTPLFNASGDVVAITSIGDDQSDRNDISVNAVRIDDARSVIETAVKALQSAAAATGVRLPVEPERPYPEEALRQAARGRVGSLSAYQVAAADFDVSIITPLLVYGAQHGVDRASERERAGAPRNPTELQSALAALEDFGNWSDYVSDYPPVVMIRVTPKLAEGFWTTVARGAAQTQGVALPAMKRPKGSFASMRLSCGPTEVTPIHPFKIERRVRDANVAYEGLYVFAPDAIGPQCPDVTLTLFSEKDPAKGDTRVVDPRIVEQIQKDFASYR